MSIELFAIGSSGLALVALVLMVASRTHSVRLPMARLRRTENHLGPSKTR